MSKVTELALTFTRSKVLDGVEVPKATKDYSGRAPGGQLASQACVRVFPEGQGPGQGWPPSRPVP